MALDPKALNDSQVLSHLIDIAISSLTADMKDLSTMPLDRRPSPLFFQSLHAWIDHAHRLKAITTRKVA